MKQIILLYGEDAFAIEEFEKNFISEKVSTEWETFNLETLDGSEISADRISESVNSPPFGSLAETHQADGPIFTLFCCYVHLSFSFLYVVVSFKAITALIELEALQRELSQREPTRQDAEFFQPRLGALVALASGGVLRPGSVAGLWICTFLTVSY